MDSLENKKVLLAITGGIAAYKAAELCRLLKKADMEVRVVMTRGAQAFITPLTMQALSGNPVHTDLLDPEAEAGMGHIELAKWADLIVVAPASADFLARMRTGMADDLLATLCLATDKVVALVPAMNQQMWANSATQENIKVLAERGSPIWGPASGEQACGDVGLGRMLEAQQVFEQVKVFFCDKALKGQRWLITAGPTQEKIDPVRYLTNRSSGKMGFAIAQAARQAGAEVVLVTGPVNLDSPWQVKRIDVQSAEQMLSAVQQQISKCDVFVSCAAVSDYKPANVSEQKMKKTGDAGLKIELEQNPDILSWAANNSTSFCVGFAAETQNVSQYAQAKMERKNIKMICANDVSRSDIGFNSDYNELNVFHRQVDMLKQVKLENKVTKSNAKASSVKEYHLGPASKKQLAKELVELIDSVKSSK